MYEYACKIGRVVDGDTMDVIIDLGFSIQYKTRVRLVGINTPEKRTRDLEEKARGIKASAYALQWCESQEKGRIFENPGGALGLASFGPELLDAVIESAEECPGECIYIEA